MSDLLLAKMPFYRRARGYRIYGEQGERFLDFFQDGGHAILGHRRPGITLEMKNILSRGQVAPYPSRYLRLAEKAVKQLIPNAVEVRFYRTGERALAAAADHLKTTRSQLEISDPALPKQKEHQLSWWRPFLESNPGTPPLLLPVLPLSTPPAPAALVFREAPAQNVPLSDHCSPLSLAAVKKSIFELITHIEKVDRSAWAEFDFNSLWSRKGPYLTLNIEEGKFGSLFSAMLDNGFLLSPRYPGPSIIPGEYSTGELAKFLRVLNDGVG